MSQNNRLISFIKNPYKSLWQLTIPMMLGMGVQAIYMLVDTLYIGRWVGANALGALQFLFPAMFIIMGIMFGLGSGGTALIAKYIGQNKRNLANNCAIHLLAIGTFISLVILIFGMYYIEILLHLQKANLESISLALEYFQITIFGIPFMILSVFLRSILSGEGDNTFPMIVLGTGTIINIILDPFLIYYYGIGGAALATVISQIVVFFIFIYSMAYKQTTYLAISSKYFNFDLQLIKNILYLGVPASLSMLIMSFGVLIFNTILSDFEHAVAAYGIAARIEHLFFLPIISLATSIVTLIGMFYGAKRIDLVEEIINYGLKIAIIISTSFTILFYFYGPYLASFFSDSKNIAIIINNYYSIFVFSYPFISIGIISSRSMQGLGNATPMLILTVLRVIIISCSLAWYFIKIINKPIEYAWGAQLISCACTALIGLIWLNKTIRNKKLSY